MFSMPVDPKSLSLVIYPDPILRTMSEDIDPSDAIVQAVARSMIEIMLEQQGIGLAAPQVGLPWRLFVTRDPENEEGGIAWINPRLEVTNKELVSDEEGCLSLPEIRGEVRRPAGIQISGHSIDGQPITTQSDDFIARVWQHENDHLDGILITDKMSTMDKLVNRRLIRALERGR
jgi:peptide deformylase